MLAYTRIMCPIDFSDLSYEALKVAAEFAEQHSSELLALHVVHPSLVMRPSPGGPVFSPVPQLQEQKAASEKVLREEIEKRMPESLIVKTTVTIGDPAEEILRVAEENRMDIIIIASHGVGGLKRYFIGSVIEKVVRASRTPVLVIPVWKNE